MRLEDRTNGLLSWTIVCVYILPWYRDMGHGAHLKALLLHVVHRLQHYIAYSKVSDIFLLSLIYIYGYLFFCGFVFL